jgi:hypothetical protein
MTPSFVVVVVVVVVVALVCRQWRRAGPWRWFWWRHQSSDGIPRAGARERATTERDVGRRRRRRTALVYEVVSHAHVTMTVVRRA